jgi:hypothetical protein
LHAFLNQAIAFQWATYYVPCWGQFFLSIQGNRQVCFRTKSSERLKELRVKFERWNPTDEDPMVAKKAALEKARNLTRKKSN